MVLVITLYRILLTSYEDHVTDKQLCLTMLNMYILTSFAYLVQHMWLSTRANIIQTAWHNGSIE